MCYLYGDCAIFALTSSFVKVVPRLLSTYDQNTHAIVYYAIRIFSYFIISKILTSVVKSTSVHLLLPTAQCVWEKSWLIPTTQNDRASGDRGRNCECVPDPYLIDFFSPGGAYQPGLHPVSPKVLFERSNLPLLPSLLDLSSIRGLSFSPSLLFFFFLFSISNTRFIRPRLTFAIRLYACLSLLGAIASNGRGQRPKEKEKNQS